MGSWEYDFPWKCVGMTILGRPLGLSWIQGTLSVADFATCLLYMAQVDSIRDWETHLAHHGTTWLRHFSSVMQASFCFQATGCNKYSKVHGFYTWTSVGSNGNQSKALWKTGTTKQWSTSTHVCATVRHVQSELHHR